MITDIRTENIPAELKARNQWVNWKGVPQKDGKLDKSELDPAFHETFDRGDADGDGFLVDQEIDDAFQYPVSCHFATVIARDEHDLCLGTLDSVVRDSHCMQI